MPYKDTRKLGYWVGEVNIVKPFAFRKRQGGFKTKREAASWERNMKKQLIESTTEAKVEMTLADWMKEYLSYSRRFSSKVYSEKKCEFERFMKSEGINPDQTVSSLKREQVYRYYESRYREKGPKVVNTKVRKNLGAAYEWGIRFYDFQKPNPFYLIDKYPESEERGHYVPPEEDFWKVYALARGQDRLLLLTFLHTAGRRSEVYGLKWVDIELELQQIALKTRKTYGGSVQTDWIALTDELTRALRQHREKADSEYVFTQKGGPRAGEPYREYRGFPKKLCDIAKVTPFGCHGIRGLTATILAKKGVSAKAIQEILRHKKLATTERYIRSTGRTKHALERAFGSSSDRVIQVSSAERSGLPPVG